MPKLSQQTLEKRFFCSHCSRTFRTRQGLSGHIQFKHSSVAALKGKSHAEFSLEITEKFLSFKRSALIAQFKEAEISEMLKNLGLWERIRILFEGEHITLNNTDYKNYLIVSLAYMQANQLLFNKLQQELDTTISKILEIQSNITEGIIKKFS